MTGFFEETDGVRSMSRLTILLVTVLAGIVVCSTSWYLIHAKDPSAAVIAAMGGVLGTLVIKGAVALITRNGQPESPDA